MSTPVIQVDPSITDMPAAGQRQQGGWKSWLARKPFTVVSSALYIILLSLLLTGTCNDCQGQPWKVWLLATAFLALLTLDCLDFWFFDAVPQSKPAVALLAIRFLLVEVVVQLWGHWMVMWMYALLPYIASLYLGRQARLLIGGAVWLLFFGHTTIAHLPSAFNSPGQVSDFVSEVTLFSFLLVFVMTLAKIVDDERESRTRAEELLASVASTHRWLTHYAEHALTITQERNDLAREIHDCLGHSLAVVNVQLEKALTFRSLDSNVAEQAVRDAKRLASEALQQVRRSVRALRAAPTMLNAPDGIVDEQPVHPSKSRGWRFWLAPRAFDAVTATIYIGLLLQDLGWSDMSDPLISWKNLILTIIVVILLALDRLDYRFFGEIPGRKVGVLLLATRVLLLFAVAASSGIWYTMWLFPLLPYIGFTYFGQRGGYVVTGLVPLLLMAGIMKMASSDIASGQFQMMSVLGGTAFVSILLLLVVSTSKRVLRERESRQRAERLRDELEHAHAQLKAYAQHVLAATEDRNQLARDIHDGLGHYLTVVNVQLEKALAFRTIEARVADQAIHDAKRLAREALEDVRSSLGSLDRRQSPRSLWTRLTQMASNVGSNLVVDIHILGTEEEYSAQSLMILYRVAQEGLTNIQKHAGADHALIELVFDQQEVRLFLRDNGCGFEPGSVQSSDNASYGLQGMRERLELVGGSLELESQPGGGTELRITVPKEPLKANGRTIEQRGADNQ